MKSLTVMLRHLSGTNPETFKTKYVLYGRTTLAKTSCISLQFYSKRGTCSRTFPMNGEIRENNGNLCNNPWYHIPSLWLSPRKAIRHDDFL